MPGTCSPRRARPARRRPRRAPRRRPLGRAPRRRRPCPARPPRRRWRPRRRPRRCRPRRCPPRRPPPRRRRPLPPPCRPPPRPRRRRAAPRPRSPRASHPAPPAPRTPTAARRAAARRARGRSAGRALVRRVAPSGGRSVAASADHWRVARRSGMRRPMAEAVGERRSGGRQGALLAQYLRIKAQHRRAILLFRLGDFYEMFFEDAATAARDLDLTLTARNRGDPDEVPLCGFPAHAAQPYITRLLAKGHTVAVCEQAPARGPDLPPPVDAACREGRPWAAAVLPEPVPLEGDLPRLAARAAGGALAYVDAAYRRRPAHLRPPEAYAPAGFLQLDAATRRNLELLQTLGGERRGSLLWVLDQTATPMGARRLREWLLPPPRAGGDRRAPRCGR